MRRGAAVRGPLRGARLRHGAAARAGRRLRVRQQRAGVWQRRQNVRQPVPAARREPPLREAAPAAAHRPAARRLRPRYLRAAPRSGELPGLATPALACSAGRAGKRRGRAAWPGCRAPAPGETSGASPGAGGGVPPALSEPRFASRPGRARVRQAPGAHCPAAGGTGRPAWRPAAEGAARRLAAHAWDPGAEPAGNAGIRGGRAGRDRERRLVSRQPEAFGPQRLISVAPPSASLRPTPLSL